MTETPTHAQDALPGADLDWNDPSSLPIGEVKELFVMLGKALRAQQLYDENNPVYQRFVSQLAEALGNLWHQMDRLQVSVEEDRFTWMGEEVYRSTSHSDSLAFLLYKDGIREFTLLEGLEEKELTTLLKVLNRARDLRPEGDDLLTVLWEKDLRYFRYQYVDVLAEGVDLPETGEGSPGRFQEVLREEVGDGAEREEGVDSREEDGSSDSSQISTEDFNPTLYSLDPHEMARVEKEIRMEMDRDLRGDVLAALFDRVEEPRFPERQQEILEIFRTLLPNFLSRGALSSAGMVLEEIARLLAAKDALKEEQRVYARQILAEVSAPSTLEELVRALEDGAITPDPSELAAFLRHLRSGALRPLLRAAEVAEDRGIKAIIQAAVKEIAQKYRAAVIECMDDPDAIVVAGACSLAGKIGLSEAAPHVANLMAHESPGVRLAAVEAAVDLKASSAVGGLQEALHDEERDIRISAARALGALRFQPAAPYLRAVIQGRAIRQADISEQIAIFESYGLLQDPEGIKVLDRLLNGRGFLGKKESGEIRACAALALGKFGTLEAERVLRRAQGEQDPVVRTAVNRALKGEG